MASRVAIALAILSVACIASFAAAQTAYTSGNCGAMSGDSLTLGSCQSRTYTQSTDVVTLSLTVTKDDIKNAGAGAKLEIYAWNPTRSNNAWGSVSGSTFKLVEPSADFSNTNPQDQSFGTLLTGFESGGTQCNVISYIQVATPCAGVYQVRATWSTSVSLPVLFLTRLRAPATPQFDKDNSWTAMNYLLPDSGAVKVPITNHFWSTVGWPMSREQWRATTSLASSSDVVWTAAELSDTANNNLNVGASLSVTELSTTVTFATEKAVKAPANGAMAQVVVPVPTSKTNANSYAKDYDWSTLGPFIPLTIEDLGASTFPDITTQQNGVQVNKAGNAPDYQVFQMPLPFNWLAYNFEFTNILDKAGTGSRINDVPSVFVAEASALKGADPTAAGSYGAALSDPTVNQWNSNFRTGGKSPVGANRVFLAPGIRNPRYKPLYFVFIQRGSCNGVMLTFDAIAKVTSISGECQSYLDCNSDDTHPAEAREDYSANGDAKRFRHCLVRDAVQASDATVVPTTQCVECQSDCECGEGQYCQTQDEGLCQGANGAWWVCDAWTNARWGLCVTRDTSPLGQYCRTTNAPVATQATNWISTSANLPVVMEAPVATLIDTEVQDDLSGFGFCGEVRSYNATALHDGNDWLMYQPELTRKVMWTGVCVNQVCMECHASTSTGTPGGDPGCPNDRSCINGRWRNNVYVDQTLRTFNQNTVAGTTLAAVFMLILLNLCSFAQILVGCNRSRNSAPPALAKETTNPISGV